MKVRIGNPTKSKQKVRVRIDKHDTWDMDITLAHIVVPMLKQLLSTVQYCPPVDITDVPNSFRWKEAYGYDELTECKLYAGRWKWVLKEMLFAFENKIDYSFEDAYFTDDGYDEAGMKKHQERVANGFRLFGKYYESLWD